MESTWTAHPATDEAFDLGEGPCWDAARQLLFWVDIRKGYVIAGRVHGDRIVEEWRWSFDGMVGAASVGPEGRVIVAAHERVEFLEADGTSTPGPQIVPSGSGRRLNDGKPDPAGRFVVGTALIDESGHEVLVRLEADGSVTLLDDDLTLSNGLGWSVDGRSFYLADTYRGVIWVRDYDAATGAVGPRRELVRFEDGHPDGLCVDAEDHLWVAMYGAGEVRRLNPAGGIMGRVLVDAANVTCPAFAGPGLDRLVITTATQYLTPEQLAQQPNAGRIFIADVGVAGAPVAVWAPPYGTITS